MIVRLTRRLLALLIVLFVGQAGALDKLPELLLPAPGLQPEQLAVVINTRDVLSWRIAEYYRKRHGIPKENLIQVSFDPAKPSVHPGEFAVMKHKLDTLTPAGVQAYLLTWAQPYRVGCMSITSAVAFGFDKRYCAKGCVGTAVNEYARSSGFQAWDEFGIRPAMMLAADNFSDARALINRGVLSQGWYFKGPGKRPAAYLVTTREQARSVRKVYFADVERYFGERLPVHIEHSEGITGADDIMFYFTGARFVEGLRQNRYLPGAVADHLTSSGGKLTNSNQMSAMAWLQAGATGSYGTVVEPCNLLPKFPDPRRLMALYLGGHTLLDAYWKSVLMPGQGVFIGDPLAAPFRGYRMREQGGALTVETGQLEPGSYKLLAADSADGPFRSVRSGIEIDGGWQQFQIEPPYAPYYRLERLLTLEFQSVPLRFGPAQ